MRYETRVIHLRQGWRQMIVFSGLDTKGLQGTEARPKRSLGQHDAHRHDHAGSPQGHPSAPLRPGAGRHRPGRRDRSLLAHARRKPEAAGRRLHQAGEDGHRPGDLPDRGDRHRRHARPGKGRPRGGQGLRLLLLLLDPGPDPRDDRRQCRAARRGHEHRPGHPDDRQGRDLRVQGPRPVDRRLPDAHHSRHRGQRLRRGRDPAGAVLLDPVRPVAGHGRRAGQAGGRLPGERSPKPSSSWSTSS
jgi:hypothetical protein